MRTLSADEARVRSARDGRRTWAQIARALTDTTGTRWTGTDVRFIAEHPAPVLVVGEHPSPVDHTTRDGEQHGPTHSPRSTP